MPRILGSLCSEGVSHTDDCYFAVIVRNWLMEYAESAVTMHHLHRRWTLLDIPWCEGKCNCNVYIRCNQHQKSVINIE